jgi:hypothetical protein
MTTAQSHLRKPAVAAVIALGVLLIGAIVFYKERMLFGDASYIVFTIIDQKALAIQVGRYGSFITQAVPYLGVKLGLPLKAVLISYSASFNAFYLLVVSILTFGYRQARLAILMALYYFLFISDSYFWPNNEIHQAVAWMFLFFGTTLYLGKKNTPLILSAAVFIPLVSLAVSTHYVVIIPTAFLWIYLLLEKSHWPFSIKESVLLSLLLLAIFGIKFCLSGREPYENSHLHNVTHFSLQDIIDSFSKPVIRMFLYNCMVNYWLGILIFAIGLYHLTRKKQWKLFTWSLLVFVGYMVIMGLTYASEPNLLLFHMESEWACISVITATPFVFCVLPDLKTSRATWLLMAIFVVRSAYIRSAIDTFSSRIAFQQEVLAQMQKKNITKLAINDELVRAKYLIDWGLTYETILSSALAGDRPQSTFMFVNPDDKKKLEGLANPKLLYNNGWDAIPATSVSNNYFSVDTLRPYTVMTYEQLFSQ